jgi:hypothetical protein
VLVFVSGQWGTVVAIVFFSRGGDVACLLNKPTPGSLRVNDVDVT